MHSQQPAKMPIQDIKDLVAVVTAMDWPEGAAFALIYRDGWVRFKFPTISSLDGKAPSVEEAIMETAHFFDANGAKEVFTHRVPAHLTATADNEEFAAWFTERGLRMKVRKGGTA